MERKFDKKQSKKFYLLIFFCWLAYTSAYLGRYSFSSSINSLMDFFQKKESAIGLAATLNFVAYGIGQVINGILCKKYNPGIMLSISLFVSSAVNIYIGLMPVTNFPALKYVWMVNGFAQSTLWPTIIFTLKKNLPKEFLNKGIIVMSSTLAFGTFIIYGMSAAFSAFSIPRSTFIFAGAATILTGLITLLFFNKFKNESYKLKKEFSQDEIEMENVVNNELANTDKKKVKLEASFIALFSVMAFGAIVNNLVADGVRSWTPTMLKELYGMDNSIALLLTMILPLFGIFASFLSVALFKKINNFYVLLGLWYVMTAVIFGIVVLCLPVKAWLITFIGILAISLMMNAVNNTITSIFPLYAGENHNSGMIAGLLDGFCYIGSAISQYGLGSIAENMSWNAVLFFLLIVTVIPSILCFVLRLFTLKKKNKN